MFLSGVLSPLSLVHGCHPFLTRLWFQNVTACFLSILFQILCADTFYLSSISMYSFNAVLKRYSCEICVWTYSCLRIFSSLHFIVLMCSTQESRLCMNSSHSCAVILILCFYWDSGMVQKMASHLLFALQMLLYLFLTGVYL